MHHIKNIQHKQNKTFFFLHQYIREIMPTSRKKAVLGLYIVLIAVLGFELSTVSAGKKKDGPWLPQSGGRRTNLRLGTLKDSNLIPTPTKNATLTSLIALVDGVYSFELASSPSRESDCDMLGSPEYLGFNNRTCSTLLSSRLTAGPVIRGPSTSMMWREWMVRVLDAKGDSNQQSVRVSLQAFVRPEMADTAKCLGYLSTFYENPDYDGGEACSAPPYGNGVFLNGTKSDSAGGAVTAQSWTVRAFPGGEDGLFELVASNKPASCSRLLGVEQCSSRAVLVEQGMSGPTLHTAWKLTRRYDISPGFSPPPSPQSSSPSPVPSPGGSPPEMIPTNEIPGPVISAPSSTSSGYVNVLVASPGGNERCSVSQIVITASAGSVGSSPTSIEVAASKPGLSSAGVPVPLRDAGYHSIYAVGKCSEDATTVTERSNGLSVFYSLPPTIPVFYLAGNGVTVLCPYALINVTATEPINGVIYTKRDRAGLEALISQELLVGYYHSQHYLFQN